MPQPSHTIEAGLFRSLIINIIITYTDVPGGMPVLLLLYYKSSTEIAVLTDEVGWAGPPFSGLLAAPDLLLGVLQPVIGARHAVLLAPGTHLAGWSALPPPLNSHQEIASREGRHAGRASLVPRLSEGGQGTADGSVVRHSADRTFIVI